MDKRKKQKKNNMAVCVVDMVLLWPAATRRPFPFTHIPYKALPPVNQHRQGKMAERSKAPR